MMKQLASWWILFAVAIGATTVEATTKRKRKLGTGIAICHKVSETKHETIFVSAFKSAFLLTKSEYKSGACSDRCHVYCLAYDSYTIASYNCNCYETKVTISDRGGTKGNFFTERQGQKEAANGALDPRFPSATVIAGKMMGGMMMTIRLALHLGHHHHSRHNHHYQHHCNHLHHPQ